MQFARPIKVGPPEWLRGPARLEGEHIVLDTRRAERYPPMATTDLAFDLAAIRRPSDSLEFCRRYGLLWHGPDSEDYREEVSRWQDEALELTGVLQLNSAVRRAVAGDQAAVTEMRESWDPILASILDAPGVSEHLGGTRDDQLLIVASSFVATTVSEKLAGVEEGIGAAVDFIDPSGTVLGPPGAYIFTPHPQNLLGYAYHHVALLLVGREPTDVCLECGRFFLIADRRQQFCSKSCAGRARQRRWIQRRRDHATHESSY